jgi:homoserine/homoserine lactone efflux protein
LLGATALFLALLSDGAYALAAAGIGARLKPAAMRLMTRIGGGALIGGGLWLAFSRERPAL